MTKEEIDVIMLPIIGTNDSNIKAKDYIEKDYNNFIEKLNKLDLDSKQYNLVKKFLLQKYINVIFNTMERTLK